MIKNANLTAIIVDDDYNTVVTFTDFLQFNGIRVVGTGSTGRDAVKMYEKLRPSVVFLDVMMPKPYDGFYALENIRKTNPDAIVIMITADLTEQTEDRLRQLCASAIVYKPFDIKRILQILDGLLAKNIRIAKINA
ncbi:response regulator [Candidatus Nitrosotenuis chungbukensis]|uniref:response regulator n=1 Tax=Candidatus Nitrosotenuis chungbukensis TaxID=1353246 RepID=UPI0005B2AB60|nr:response regulator [Candidatus Nitrosotenuis chungbukensis]WKT57964.1 response regulator [Candidatus Nitrosotenuis chungbukensis]